MSDMQGRVVMVTGGTGVLGVAVVGRLVQRGARCIVPCLKEDELKRFPYRETDGVRVVLGVDLADEPSVQMAYAKATEGSSRLWASVHIAGGFAYAPIATMSHADYSAQIRTNLDTCFLCCREAVKAMRAAGSAGDGGRIVNVAARPALEPRLGANMTAYTAAKCAVAGLTQALAEEVVGDRILVNAVLPSIMDTPVNRKNMPTADFSKWAKVEDVAATIAFLASAENTCTRGGLVPVYGAA